MFCYTKIKFKYLCDVYIRERRTIEYNIFKSMRLNKLIDIVFIIFIDFIKADMSFFYVDICF